MERADGRNCHGEKSFFRTGILSIIQVPTNSTVSLQIFSVFCMLLSLKFHSSFHPRSVHNPQYDLEKSTIRERSGFLVHLGKIQLESSKVYR